MFFGCLATTMTTQKLWWLWWLWCDVNKKDLADDDYATDEDSIGDNVNIL